MTDDRHLALATKSHEWHGQHDRVSPNPHPVPAARPPSNVAPSRHAPQTEVGAAARPVFAREVDYDALAQGLVTEAVLGLLLQGSPVNEANINAWLHAVAAGQPELTSRAASLAKRILNGPLPLG